MSRSRTKSGYPDVQVCACANLRRATRMVTQAYDAALRPAGLRATQFTMLSVLAIRGQIRQREFADILGMDGTTLTRNLQPLLKNGWIQIDREKDQRVRLISIAKPGRRVLDRAVPLWREVQSQFVTGLGDERWSGLLGTLATAADIAQRD
ncbi:MAG: winged helix-turn-helix transcriptional regulator [Proteobacteria bacterium]|nr:winged helix-turn-helix transcriptional regulator [Pseudomonadota bacterium]MCH8996776.1 winged helix-turn-helix transcriptional regulator [Pseudomonadota bacterium]